MFNEKDILARLQNGENVDDIAKEVIGLVNKANSTYEEDKRKKEEAEKNRKSNQLREMRHILGSLDAYLDTYYSQTKGLHKLTEIDTVQEIVDLIDEGMEIAESASKLSSLLENKYGDLKPKVKSDLTDLSKNCDDILLNFVKNQGW